MLLGYFDLLLQITVSVLFTVLELVVLGLEQHGFDNISAYGTCLISRLNSYGVHCTGDTVLKLNLKLMFVVTQFDTNFQHQCCVFVYHIKNRWDDHKINSIDYY